MGVGSETFCEYLQISHNRHIFSPLTRLTFPITSGPFEQWHISRGLISYIDGLADSPPFAILSYFRSSPSSSFGENQSLSASKAVLSSRVRLSLKKLIRPAELSSPVKSSFASQNCWKTPKKKKFTKGSWGPQLASGIPSLLRISTGLN